MNALPVILIFDVGKTNKKLLLFNEQYKLVYEESTQLPEIEDEDGFPCEDINALTKWIWESHWKISNNKNYNIRGINFSGYGASFVHLNDYYKPFTPLYSYLKPYPDALLKQFYDTVWRRSAGNKRNSLSGIGQFKFRYAIVLA